MNRAYHSGMESIISNVRDLEADKRRSLEAVLGQQLEDNQQVIIRVLTPGVEPEPAARRQALERVRALSRKAAANRESLGVSEAEADRIVDEAMEQIRPRNNG